MPKLIDGADLRQMWDDRDIGPERTMTWVNESLALGRNGEAGELHASHFSVRNLFETLVPDGDRIIKAMTGRRGVRTSLLEDVSAVDTSTFSPILGQLLISEILRGYQSPELIWPKLCHTVDTIFPFGEKIPGIAGLGDVAEAVGEGKDYPLVGMSPEFIQTQPLEKRGFIVQLTREILIADRTGLLVERANKGGQWLAVNLEKRVIDVAVGVVNNYNRNGVATNTYLTSGAYINAVAVNPLTAEWKAVQAGALLWDAMNDPNTGEPIMVGRWDLLVPTALVMDAQRIATATSIETVDNTAAAVTVRTQSANPLAGRVGQIISSPYVKRRTGSATQWFMGDFKDAIAKMTMWGIEEDQLGSGSHNDFYRDVPMAFKASCMDRVQMVEPRLILKNHT